MLGCVVRTGILDVCESMNHPQRYFNMCARLCVYVCVSTVPSLSCCLFIIDAALTTSIFANYPSTHIHAHTNRKCTKKQDIALAEKQQDKQHPTSKFWNALFLVNTSTSPYLPSYLCLFSSFPFLSPSLLHFISFMSLSHHTCSLPFALSLYTLPPVHHSHPLLFACHSLPLVLILLPP